MLSLTALKLSIDSALQKFLTRVERCYSETDWRIPWSRNCSHNEGSSMHHQLLNSLVPYDDGEVSNVHLLTLCLLDDSQLAVERLSHNNRGPAQNDQPTGNDGGKTIMAENVFTSNGDVFSDLAFEESCIEFRSSFSWGGNQE